jgi:threonine synthase
MRLTSTRHAAPEATFLEALLRGLAPDGGLYLPTSLPPIAPDQLASWQGLEIADIAVRVLTHLVGDEFDRDAFQALVREAFDFPAPTVSLKDGLAVLELFHGPTLAFKDFGARFLARTFGHVLTARGDHATILVATSGDTGSAVALGFHGVPRVQVVVLYPAGKVSRFQEAQMATLGGNVRAVRVPGTFDDCQRLVKQAFLDDSLADLNLSSANSINIGRLLPQTVYYFAAWLAMGGPAAGDVVFAVPSGNLGNLTAGVIAQRIGLPVRRFIAACNVNDVLPEYLRTGTYRARPARPTISNAMDVGDPSNFPRLAQLHGQSLAALQANLSGVSIDEEETRRTIRQVYEANGYVLDPHSAVAIAAAARLRQEAGERRPIIALATAHPAKFGDVIREELGFTPELPERWRDWSSRPITAIDLETIGYADFRARLRQARASRQDAL